MLAYTTFVVLIEVERMINNAVGLRLEADQYQLLASSSDQRDFMRAWKMRCATEVRMSIMWDCDW